MEVRKSESSDSVYGIYAGDFQFRTPQDQGPVQNAVFDKGLVSVAIRSLYADAAAPAHLIELIRRTYAKVPDKSAFTGLKGMGDYGDLGCDQEFDRLRLVVRLLLEENPDLRFTLLTPGNHDGGFYMGTLLRSGKSLLADIWYPSVERDAKLGQCGEAESMLERGESVAELLAIVQGTKDNPEKAREKITTHIKAGGRAGFRPQDGKRLSFKKDADQIFTTLWKENAELGRYDAILHVNNNVFDHHHDEHENGKKDIFSTISEATQMRRDPRQWIELQATRQAEFATSAGVPVPVYEIALDTMDLTKAGPFAGAIKGHISQLQISAAENFMNAKLAENPNAKFKLTMHYPVSKMVACARGAMKRLLEREDVILVADAHVHERGFTADMRDEFKLKRNTPLAHLTVPSAIDMPREVVLEKMSFTEIGGKGRIDFDFTFESLPETAIPGYNPTVKEALDYFEALLAAKKQDAPKIGDKTYLYINEDEVIAGLSPRMKRIANNKAKRDIQIGELLTIFFRLGASHKFIAEGSLRQMKIDFDYFLDFLDLVTGLLQLENPDKAKVLKSRVAEMRTYYDAWKVGYLRHDRQKRPFAERRSHNDLYTNAHLDDVFQFLNQELPQDGATRAFFTAIGMRATAEEREYHGDKMAAVPGNVTAAAVFDLK